jgi:capsule polysaccharide export protein KpsE/RkpR
VSPSNKDPVRIIERPPEAPSNGHAVREVESAESRRVYWIRLLWKDRRLLRNVMLYGLALAIVISFLLPVRFESRTRIMPPDQQGSGLAMLAALAGRGSGSSGGSGGGVGAAIGGSIGGLAGDLLGVKSSGALFVDMLNGPTIEKFDLLKRYNDRYWEDARKDLEKHIGVKEDRKSEILTITVSDRDPARAQQMTQAYIDALNSLLSRVSTSSARRERIFLGGRLRTVKQDMDTAAQQFSEFASKNGTLNVPEQTKAMVESEASLEGQLVAAESELAGLKEIYKDNNIRVKTLSARIAGLKSQIENMSGNKADLSSDQSNIAGDFPSIRKLPLVGVRWANLYRENKIQETVYELLTQEYELAKIQEAKEIPTVNVVDPPLMPERKSFPPRILISVAASIIALMLGCMYVIGSDAWRSSQSPERQLAADIWAQLRNANSEERGMFHRLFSNIGAHSHSNGSNRSNGSNGRAA